MEIRSDYNSCPLIELPSSRKVNNIMTGPVNTRISSSMKFPLIECGCFPSGRKVNIR